MAHNVLFNGTITDKNISINSESLFFNYGFGFFETILSNENGLMFYQEHIDRLKNAVDSISMSLNFSNISKELIENYIKYVGIDSPNKRVKISVFDNGDNELSTLVQVYDYLRDINNKTVWIDSQVKDLSINNFKSINYMHNYLRKDFFSKTYGVDEIFFLNEKKRILEGSFTNIAIVWNNNIYFVDKKENYLDGVMQQKVEQYSTEFGFKKVIYKKRGFAIKMLRECDEVILLNSMQIAVTVEKIFNQKKQNIIVPKYNGYADKIRKFFLEDGVCR